MLLLYMFLCFYVSMLHCFYDSMLCFYASMFLRFHASMFLCRDGARGGLGHGTAPIGPNYWIEFKYKTWHFIKSGDVLYWILAGYSKIQNSSTTCMNAEVLVFDSGHAWLETVVVSNLKPSPEWRCSISETLDFSPNLFFTIQGLNFHNIPCISNISGDPLGKLGSLPWLFVGGSVPSSSNRFMKGWSEQED